jgi:predicted enzyme related to lactoylglutathione lyase
MTMQFKAVYPISGEDTSALPVRDIGPAVEFYQTVLGFTWVSGDDSTAVLRRDGTQIGLVRKADHKPTEAGSCCFDVDDLDAAHRELDGRGLDRSEIRIDEWNGRKYRVFFLREDENGYCFCFSQPA